MQLPGKNSLRNIFMAAAVTLGFSSCAPVLMPDGRRYPQRQPTVIVVVPDNRPVYRQPVYRAPVYRAPVYRPPVYQPAPRDRYYKPHTPQKPRSTPHNRGPRRF